MSGGSYDYAYQKIRDMADSLREASCCVEYAGAPALRRAFAAHLRKVAAACRAIEWNDSGDGDDRERELIAECLPANAELKEAVSGAEKARAELTKALERAKAKT